MSMRIALVFLGREIIDMIRSTMLRRRSGSRLHSRWRQLLMIVCLVPLFLAGLPALASGDFDDEYDPTDSGHPLRIVAYILHPVGVILDTLIFRPAHWLGTKEPIKTLVGNED
jgi:hypothetical protein